MVKYLSLALLLLFATAASAQSLKLPTVVFAGAATADWVTTYHVHKTHDMQEHNPLINWLEPHPAKMVMLGAAIDSVGLLAWHRFVGSRHRKIAAVGLYAAAGFRVALAANNLRAATHAKRRFISASR